MGEAVSLAVDRFVVVGESIGDEHPELRSDMCETCMEARQAGESRAHNFSQHDGGKLWKESFIMIVPEFRLKESLEQEN